MTSLMKVKRKIKRLGKSAVQFRISSTFEFVELECQGTWRPEKLRVIWLRNHRRVKSNDTTMVVTEDFGPNGAKGKAIFNPAIAVSLLVTLYRDSNHTDFEEKEYKYMIESESESGKKILATFNCNVAEFVGIPSTKQALDLNLKCVSKKVKAVKLGITLECTFMKEGKAMDDDMQSTFSAMSTGVESITYDEEDDDETDGNVGGATREAADISPVGSVASNNANGGNRDRLNTLLEESETDLAVDQSLVLGTGEHIKRGTIPRDAPPKPARGASFRSPSQDDQKEETHVTVNSPPENGRPYDPTSPGSVAHAMNAQIPTIVVASGELEENSKSEESKAVSNGTSKSSERPLEGKSQSANSSTARGPLPSDVKQVKKLPEAESHLVNGSSSESQPKEIKENGVPHGQKLEMDSKKVGHSKSAQIDKVGPKSGSKKVEPKASHIQEVNRKSEQAPKVEIQSNHDQNPKPVQGLALEVKKVETVKSESHLVEEAKKNASRVQKVKVKAEVEAKVPRPVVVNQGVQTQATSQERRTKKTVNQETQTQTADRTKAQTVNEGTQTVNQEVQVRTADQGIQTEPEVAASAPSADDDEPKPKLTISDMPLIKETVLDSPRNSPPVSLARADQAASTAASSSPSRKAIEPKETHVPPSNPYLEEEEEEETMAEDQPKKLSPTSKWIDSSVVFVDCFEEVMGREKLDSADVIGLYFSAGWCPPCRRFLPKLVKFYHHLKQHGKSFELIYISSDYSKQDMMKYMKEQQMPWMGVEYEGEASDNFRKTYKVSAVPLLKILGTRGYVIEESAKKSIEGASNGSAILKLYNKWHEQLEDTRVTKGSKKGLLSKIKKSKEESDETLTDGASLSSESTERVSLNSRQRSKGSKITNEKLEEKEEKIQHLEEVNKVLKQANDDMREEIEDLRAKLSTVSTEMEELRTESSRLQDESKQMVNNLNMRGWLFKRGIKGLTANRWRPRYFRLDEGSKLYYYKNSTEGTPQGFIDLEKVLSVQEVSPAQQDKNHATFNIQCDGRTFQMQAHDEPSMRRWMEAILYITEWRKRNSTVSQSRNGARP